ncbi:MAG TPA: RNA polymerase sigma-70 factor [Puia sp.]|nr:RNA polymerase sigma-70 factor [Puia sp.]
MTNYLPPIHTNGDEHELEMLFADVFKKHEHRLYSLALGLTKSEQYVKDIIQEVFLKLWEQRHHLNEIQNIEAWLYRVLENKVIDFLRKTAADNRLIDNIWNNAAQARNDTDEWIEAKEYNQIVQNAIDRLPPQRKRIYCLSKKDGLNHAQIARKLAISHHTVRNHLAAAFHSIRSFVSRNIGLFSHLF